NDPGRIQRLFDRSELARRDKWWDREDYRERTTGRALRQLAHGTGSMSTRTNQDSQDLTRNKSTAVTAGAATKELTPEQGQQAVRMAVDLADRQGDDEDWKVMFVLARRLRRLAGEAGVEAFQKAVVAFCERARQPAEDYWVAFQVCWGKVKLAEG